MLPSKYFKKFAAAVVQRSGISRATVEQVLPAVFDEIRYQLTTEDRPCVPIEGFGTFAVIDRPEHEFLYHRGDIKKVCPVPARRQLKFTPTKNMKREVEARQYDPSRRSFTRHHDDPPIRMRKDMRYRKVKGYQQGEGSWGEPIYRKMEDGRSKMEDGRSKMEDGRSKMEEVSHQPSAINHQSTTD